jgi:adenosylcobinamide-phosphate synthase
MRGLRASPLTASVAVVIDALLGDEYLRPHPVAVFGRCMTRLERRVWSDGRLAGARYAGTGLAAAVASGALLGTLPGGALVAGFTAVAGRGLWLAAAAVADALGQGDLIGARRILPSLAGRDPDKLGEQEIARAAVESVAENTVDGIVAPALWAAIFGGPGALGYRGVNTLDSMVGYRDARYRSFGWASARLDDLANFLPARATALLVAAVRPASTAEIWRSVITEAPSHPSPNAGVAEAAFGAALGIRLGGLNSYSGRLEERASMGARSGRLAATKDIGRAVNLSKEVAAALAALLALFGFLGGRGYTAGSLATVRKTT